MPSDKELEQLQQADQWEEMPDGVKPAAKNRRSVVSVSLSCDDFERISEYARKNGMKTSEFIREAALSQVQYRRFDVVQVKVSGELHAQYPRQTDRGDSSTVRMQEGDFAVTH